jgi:hypothetical protein
MSSSDLDWMSDGACKLPQNKGVRFFTEGDSMECASICAGCPVLEDCKNWSLKHEPFYYWAGMSERRRNIVREEMGIEVDQLGHDLSHLLYELKNRPMPARPRHRKPIQHGTIKGYRREVKLKMPTCLACRKANAVFMDAYKKGRVA